MLNLPPRFSTYVYYAYRLLGQVRYMPLGLLDLPNYVPARVTATLLCILLAAMSFAMFFDDLPELLLP